MILPIHAIEARVRQQCPEWLDVVEAVRAEVERDARVFANNWPAYQIASGLYARALMRHGLPHSQAQDVASVVQLAC